jgi:hypothetical protein
MVGTGWEKADGARRGIATEIQPDEGIYHGGFLVVNFGA